MASDLEEYLTIDSVQLGLDRFKPDENDLTFHAKPFWIQPHRETMSTVIRLRFDATSVSIEY